MLSCWLLCRAIAKLFGIVELCDWRERTNVDGSVNEEGCLKWSKLVVFITCLRQSNLFHILCASLLKTTRKRKIKNPWRELKTANRIEKTFELCSVTVNAPNSQLNPKRQSKHQYFISSCTVNPTLNSSSFILALKCLRQQRYFSWTATTAMYMIVFRRSIKPIGPRKAAKNTAVFPMKQLWNWERYVLDDQRSRERLREFVVLRRCNVSCLKFNTTVLTIPSSGC